MIVQAATKYVVADVGRDVNVRIGKIEARRREKIGDASEVQIQVLNLGGPPGTDCSLDAAADGPARTLIREGTGAGEEGGNAAGGQRVDLRSGRVHLGPGSAGGCVEKSGSGDNAGASAGGGEPVQRLAVSAVAGGGNARGEACRVPLIGQLIVRLDAEQQPWCRHVVVADLGAADGA